MEIVFTEEALDDFDYWKQSGDKAGQKRISALLQSIAASPFEGIGKPEALKYNHSGKWSRRITQEHRLIYRVAEGKAYILSLKGHYE